MLLTALGVRISSDVIEAIRVKITRDVRIDIDVKISRMVQFILQHYPNVFIIYKLNKNSDEWKYIIHQYMII